ncbi:MAG TPA: hypothetical protein VD997_02495 [Phycisphaerales bacterium]|nr:hypothetical protein [Phycisphaerales bacterium]
MASLCALVVMLGACGGGAAKDQAKPEARPAEQPKLAFEPFAKEAPEVMNSAPRAPGGEARQAAWSIVIVAASGEQANELAATALQKVRTVGGLPQAYTEQRGKSVVVAYGRYSGPDDPQAGRDLERIQGIEVDGERPFRGAVMVPPPFEALEGSIPEYNLSSVKKARGKDALYTLQIAMYTRLNVNHPKPEELAEFRKNAEQAVNNLRREGEEAFYYHGQRGSMVTVGVFGPKDHDVTKPGRESFALSEARRKYPFNLVNGAQLLVKVKNQAKASAQPSFLVPIPE